jgi:hypothetical protein
LGTKEAALEIKNKVSKFLIEKLKIELNEDKTKITNLREECANFLGFKIKATTAKFYESRIAKVCSPYFSKTYIKRAPYGTIKLYIPFERIEAKLREKGFLRTDVLKAKFFGP